MIHLTPKSQDFNNIKEAVESFSNSDLKFSQL